MTDRQKGKALLKPFQLLGIAGGLALFTGFFVILSLRNIDLALIFSGVVFVVATVVLAMLVLSYKPNPDVPVYLDRFETESGDEEHRLRVDADAALGDKNTVREEPHRDEA